MKIIIAWLNLFQLIGKRYLALAFRSRKQIKVTSNCILIGYRGVGKSTIAKLLHISMNLPLLSTDDLIEKKIGMEIHEFLKSHDWEEFRKIETQVIQETVQAGPAIIDCGGGVVEREENILLLRANGVLFWLTASIPTILERMAITGKRPSLTKHVSMEEEVREVLSKRNPIYKRASHHTISVDGNDLYKAPDKIKEIFVQVAGINSSESTTE